MQSTPWIFFSPAHYLEVITGGHVPKKLSYLFAGDNSPSHCIRYSRVICKVRQLGDKNGQFWHNRPSNTCCCYILEATHIEFFQAFQSYWKLLKAAWSACIWLYPPPPPQMFHKVLKKWTWNILKVKHMVNNPQNVWPMRTTLHRSFGSLNR
jgi:hypothetical protein